jgi:hypothetical protein
MTTNNISFLWKIPRVDRHTFICQHNPTLLTSSLLSLVCQLAESFSGQPTTQEVVRLDTLPKLKDNAEYALAAIAPYCPVGL